MSREHRTCRVNAWTARENAENRTLHGRNVAGAASSSHVAGSLPRNLGVDAEAKRVRRSSFFNLRSSFRHSRSRSARRGVLLLVVLALLAIFSLVAVAYLLLSNQARRSAETVARIELTTDSAKTLLDEAFKQVVRGPATDPTHGTSTATSVMGPHSILETMYGYECVVGVVSGTQSCGLAQLTNLSVGSLTVCSRSGTTTGDANTLAQHVGCVLTITSVPSGSSAVEKALVGESTRIVAISQSGYVQVVSFSNGFAPPYGSTFTINGVPFSGIGLGGSVTAAGSITMDKDLALEPFAMANQNPPGGINSDYTAADIQHMLLAFETSTAAGSVTTLPSMHRPALLQYLASTTVGSISTASSPALHYAMARPLGKNTTIGTVTITGDTNTGCHRDFTGSNLGVGTSAGTFNAVTGPWDVDTDGDGQLDAVWVDLGMPVRSTSDGRLYKPLFAIKCVDLDGRINLNAHGSMQDLGLYAGSTTGAYTYYSGSSGSATFAGGGTVSARGQGFGPAEISPYYVLGNTTTYYQHILYGNTTYQGRYCQSIGSYDIGGTAAYLLNANHWFDYSYGSTSIVSKAPAYWTPGSVNYAGAYGSPVDPFGMGKVGLDDAGRPVFAGPTFDSNYVGYGSGWLNNPYAVDFGPNVIRGYSSGSLTMSNLFSAGELERILRPYDADAPGLPPRLAVLSGTETSGTSSIFFQPNTRNLQKAVTTDSWDVPCPNFGAIGGTKTTSSTSTWGNNIAALLIKRGLTDSSKWTTILPADLLAGLRMDINRPFGNGLDYKTSLGDDSQNAGVVNSPNRDGSQSVTLSGVTVSAATFGTNTFSFDGSSGSSICTNTFGTATSASARQLEARYLYVLMCLTCDLNYLNNAFADSSGNTTARYIAQWAVNAVDFKSRDSSMTRFVYDPKFASSTADLSTGWSSAGGTATTVWGCKRPELLFSETLALHDLRIADTSNETDTDAAANATTDKDDGKPALYYNKDWKTGDPIDNSFDQTFRPQGSLFFELYNPQSPLQPQSGDLYTGAPGGSVNLTKVSGTSTTSTTPYPVWRVLVARTKPQPSASNPTAEQPDPDDFTLTGDSRPDIEREVYFCGTASGTCTFPPASNGTATQYSPGSSSAWQVTIAPNNYAVIGPGEATQTYQSKYPKRTYFGFVKNKEGTYDDADKPRYIDLAGTATNILQNNGTDNQPTAGSINTPATLAIDSPHRLSVSEPVNGKTYDQLENGVSTTTSGSYTNPFDRPFDLQRTDDDASSFRSTGTKPCFRVLYLQRLANPLMPYNGDPTSNEYNPYRTIDQMAVDLTIFNGVADPAPDGSYGKCDGTTLLSQGTFNFKTRQRGESNGSTAGNLNIWKQESIASGGTATGGSLTTVSYYFNNQLLPHSLGYLNTTFGSATGNSMTGEIGLPSSPFPWLTFNNRPYVTPLELMLVPTCSSSKLLVNGGSSSTNANIGDKDYNKYFNILQNSDAVNPYTAMTGSTTSSSSVTLADPGVPYPHLMNFFQSTASSATAQSAQFHRIFEYLRVPSPFVGTEIWANPTSAENGTHNFHPPFNRISSYREPGRINLNTVADIAVFRGLMSGSGLSSLEIDTLWNKFLASRQGSGTTTLDQNNILNVNATAFPTEFAHPFRSYGGWNLTPSNMRPTNEIDCTILRPDPDPTKSNVPLFQGGTSTDACRDTQRNPAFRFAGVERLGNLVTTRSNVYAVWITVGYFEVTPLPNDNYQKTYFPDGYMLGKELGIDTGETQRHRAFYIFDRSIPVGFQRGSDNNIDKAILVKRFIE